MCSERTRFCFSDLLQGSTDVKFLQAFISYVSLFLKKAQLSYPFPPQDCLLGSARCVLFQCPLHSISGQAVLKIHARLWNSSFIEVRKSFVIIT